MVVEAQATSQQSAVSVRLLHDQGMEKVTAIEKGDMEVEEGEVHGPGEGDDRMREEEVSDKGVDTSDRAVLRRAPWRVDYVKSGSIRRITRRLYWAHHWVQKTGKGGTQA